MPIATNLDCLGSILGGGEATTVERFMRPSERIGSHERTPTDPMTTVAHFTKVV